MAAGNMVLRNLKKANDPDQQHKDVEAVLRVAEAERGSNGSKGRKPLQAHWCACDGPKFGRRQSEGRYG